MKVEETRVRVRPRRSWKESVKEDMREKELEDDEYVNKAK